MERYLYDDLTNAACYEFINTKHLLLREFVIFLLSSSSDSFPGTNVSLFLPLIEQISDNGDKQFKSQSEFCQIILDEYNPRRSADESIVILLVK